MIGLLSELCVNNLVFGVLMTILLKAGGMIVLGGRTEKPMTSDAARYMHNIHTAASVFMTDERLLSSLGS